MIKQIFTTDFFGRRLLKIFHSSRQFDYHPVDFQTIYGKLYSRLAPQPLIQQDPGTVSKATTEDTPCQIGAVNLNSILKVLSEVTAEENIYSVRKQI